MLSDILVRFENNKVTTEYLIEATLGDLGAGLYAYMYMLENTDRKREAKLIENLRSIIFDTRSAYCAESISRDEVSINLEKVKSLLSVQMTMIESNPLIAWEKGFFNGYVNELCNAIYRLKQPVKVE